MVGVLSAANTLLKHFLLSFKTDALTNRIESGVKIYIAGKMYCQQGFIWGSGFGVSPLPPSTHTYSISHQSPCILIYSYSMQKQVDIPHELYTTLLHFGVSWASQRV